MTVENKVKQNCKQVITLWLLISAATKAAAKFSKKKAGTKTSTRQSTKRNNKTRECASEKLPDADAGADSSSEVQGPETKRARRKTAESKGSMSGHDATGIGRYHTEAYKENIQIGLYETKPFVPKKGKATAAQAAENVREVADLVIKDFYSHYNNGLIIPHLAGMDYNG